MGTITEIKEVTEELVQLEDKRSGLLQRLQPLTQQIYGAAHADTNTQQSKTEIKKSNKGGRYAKGAEIEGTRRWHMKRVLRQNAPRYLTSAAIADILVAEGVVTKSEWQKVRAGINVELSHFSKDRKSPIKKIGKGQYAWKE